MKELQRKLLAAFQVEHKEHLEVARRLLDALEEAGWRADAVDLVELHRRLHSLKGAARAVDLRPIEALAHRLESLITACQKGSAVLDAGTSRVLRMAFDAIEDGVAGIDDDGVVRVSGEVMTAVEAVSTGGAAPGPPPTAVAAPRPVAAPSAAVPAVAAPDPETGGRFGGDLDGLSECAAEILTATAAQHRLAMEFAELERSAEEALRAIEALRESDDGRSASGGRTAADATRARHLHALENWADRHRASVRAAGDRQQANGRQLRLLGRRLDAQVRRLRLVPADAVLGGMGRMVRELAADYGKAVRVDVRGLGTPADRAVLQELRDPVMHALRNTVGHGIEPAAERRTAGKPEEGRILLQVAARGGRLHIGIEDDGRGIDIARVRRAAIADGLHPAEGDMAQDPRALATLLAAPGLSTAETLTELAGRGMGLSVVAAAAEKLLGEFTIRPRAGGGTALTLSVPVSLASGRLVMVRCGEQVYAIPAHAVERLHRITGDRVESVEGRTVIRLGDAEPLPLVRLGDVLGASHGTTPSPGARLPVVVLRGRGARIGARVDSVLAVQDGVVRDLGPAAGTMLAGGVVTEAGEVVPVLDVQAVIEAAARPAEQRPAPETAAAAKPPSILVVDDSITTRTLEKSILEANGFRVRLSVDGADALDQLRAGAADLVISDVEMPRMDGFDLLRAMKSDSALAAIPVILVTSRNSDEDRRRGLSLGADAYVVKQRFDQRDLLTTIGQLL